MVTLAKNPKVDAFLRDAPKWRREFEALRAIVQSCPLTEELKWGCPCYSYAGANVVLIHGFKDYCALLFCKGALLKDPEKILIQQTKNVQAARQIRFTQLDQITKKRASLKRYILEAIEVEKSGAKVAYKTTADFKVVDEFKEMLAARPQVKAAFASLTPGRQKAYLLHFASAKQATTRLARIEKCVPRILAGKGLVDYYRQTKK